MARFILPESYQAGQSAPGGDEFFAVLGPYLGVAETYLRAEKVRAALLRSKNPAQRALGIPVRLIVTEMEREIRAAEIAVARAADRAIKKRIRATAKRPGPRSRRLEQSIRSNPLPTKPFATGAVGVGRMDALNQTEYWRAQEFGSKHLVGRVLRGVFQPGDAPPDQSMFREHPIFQGGSYEGAGTGAGVIRRPIEARRFLSYGTADAEALRRRLMRQIALRAHKRLAEVMVQLEAIALAQQRTQTLTRRR